MKTLKELLVLILIGSALLCLCCCGNTASEEEELIDEEEIAGPMTLTEFVNSKEQLVAYRAWSYDASANGVAKDDLVGGIAVFNNDGTVVLYGKGVLENTEINTFGDVARMSDDQVIDILLEAADKPLDTSAEESNLAIDPRTEALKGCLKGEWEVDLETDDTGNNVEFELLFIPEPKTETAAPVLSLNEEYLSWSQIYDSKFLMLSFGPFSSIYHDVRQTWYVRDDDEELDLCVDTDLSNPSFYVDEFPDGNIKHLSLPEK